MSNNPRRRGRPEHADWQTTVLRFAHNHGWWRIFAIPALAIITVWVLADILGPDPDPDPLIVQGGYAVLSTATAAANPDTQSALAQQPGGLEPAGSSPDESVDPADALGQLPPGGPYTPAGDGTFREVGVPGQDVGQGEQKVVRYSVEMENGIDPANFGGPDAFSAAVDATLADPRGWVNDPRYKFIHVPAADNPDTRIRLTSAQTAATLCGHQLESEISCHTLASGESATIINEARWVRGAQTFNGDIDGYRQYLINHEFGHAIGYDSHQPCGKQGALAPVMMQQTLSLNNSELFRKSPGEVYPDDNFSCQPNPWPYPVPSNMDLYNPATQ